MAQGPQSIEDENVRYKKLYQDMLTERNQFKQQCSQAIRQWDQALRDKNDFKEALAKVQRKHDEAVKEVNQAMTFRIKATKDVKRMAEERDAAVKEYNLIMSERDSVHKEIERLQEELGDTRKRGKSSKLSDEEKFKLQREVDFLKKVIEQSLNDRDKAVKEAHELREKYSTSRPNSGETAGHPLLHQHHSSPSSGHHSHGHRSHHLHQHQLLHYQHGHPCGTGSPTGAQHHHKGTATGATGRRSVEEAATQSDHCGSPIAIGSPKDTSSSSSQKAIDNLDAANAEIARLRKVNSKLSGELQVMRTIYPGAGSHGPVEDPGGGGPSAAGDSSGTGQWAPSSTASSTAEQCRLALEREAVRSLCDKLRRDRDRALSELNEVKHKCDDVRSQRNDAIRESQELRDRVASLEKDLRLSSLQRSPGGHSHSHDSAIDSDLQESWETENIDIHMSGYHSECDLGLDLSGGEPQTEEGNVYIAGIDKHSVLAGKLKVHDRILRINNLDCRDVECSTVLEKLRSSVVGSSTVSLVVKRRRLYRRSHEVVLSLNEHERPGISLDLGVFVSKVAQGSAAAKDGNVSVGDRILAINDVLVEHVDNLDTALALLQSEQDTLVLTIARQTSTSSSSCIHHPLSSSSSGHNMHLEHNSHHHDKGHCSSAVGTSSGIASPEKNIPKLTDVDEDSGRPKSAGHNKHVSLVTDVEMGERELPSQSEALPEKSSEDYSRGNMEEKAVSTKKNRSQRRHTVAVSNLEGTVPGSNDVKQRKPDNLPTTAWPQEQIHKKSGGAKKKRPSKDSSGTKSPPHGSLVGYMGGTWPRTRRGPVVEQRTGAILHPQKMKKERLPLTELLNLSAPPSAVPRELKADQSEFTNNRRQPGNGHTGRSNKGSSAYEFPTVYKEPGGGKKASLVLDEKLVSTALSQSLKGSKLNASDSSQDESAKSSSARKSKRTSSRMHAVPPPTVDSPSVSSPPPPMALSGSRSAYAALRAMHDIQPAEGDSPATLDRPGDHGGFNSYLPRTTVTSSGIQTGQLHEDADKAASSGNNVSQQISCGRYGHRSYTPADPVATATVGTHPMYSLHPSQHHSSHPHHSSLVTHAASSELLDSYSLSYTQPPMDFREPHESSRTCVTGYQDYGSSTRRTTKEYSSRTHTAAGGTGLAGLAALEQAYQSSRNRSQNRSSQGASSSNNNNGHRSGTFPRKRKERDTVVRHSPKPGGTLPSAGRLKSKARTAVGHPHSGSSGTDGGNGSSAASRRARRRKELAVARRVASESSDSSTEERSRRTLSRRRGSKDLLKEAVAAAAASIVVTSPPMAERSREKDRSPYREELDFTSSRNKSESVKRKQMEEDFNRLQLIQERLAMEGDTRTRESPGQRRSSRHQHLHKHRELSRSQGDGLDATPSPGGGHSGQSGSHHRRRMSKSKESLKDIENDYDEISLGVSQQANMGAHSGSPGGQPVMIEPPDLFNTNKTNRHSKHQQQHSSSAIDAGSRDYHHMCQSSGATGKTHSSTQADYGAPNVTRQRTSSRHHHSSHQGSSSRTANKRLRNRSLEMVLEDTQRYDSGSSNSPGGSPGTAVAAAVVSGVVGSSPSPPRLSSREKRERAKSYTRSLERPKPKRSDRISANPCVNPFRVTQDTLHSLRSSQEVFPAPFRTSISQF